MSQKQSLSDWLFHHSNFLKAGVETLTFPATGYSGQLPPPTQCKQYKGDPKYETIIEISF